MTIAPAPAEKRLSSSLLPGGAVVEPLVPVAVAVDVPVGDDASAPLILSLILSHPKHVTAAPKAIAITALFIHDPFHPPASRILSPSMRAVRCPPSIPSAIASDTSPPSSSS